jgi:hypothetical protein
MGQCPASRASPDRDARLRSAAPCSPMETAWKQVALQRCWMDPCGGWSCDLSIGSASRLRCEPGTALHTHFHWSLRHQPQPDVCWLDFALCWRCAHHAKHMDGCITSSRGRGYSPGRSARRAQAGASVRGRVPSVPEAGSSIPLAADVQRPAGWTSERDGGGAGPCVWPAARTSPCTRQSDNAPKVRFSATLGKEPEVEVPLV